MRPQKRALVAIPLILGGVIFFNTFGAPDIEAATQKTANTLKVSPVRTDIEVQPGSRKVVQATVTNLADSPVRVTPVANDFIAGDEKGTPALILDETQFASTHSLKRFMSPLTPVTIPAKGSKTINVVITVPVAAQAGGYFGSVRFMPSNPDEGGQVNLSPSVASLILLKVPGATVENLQLTDFAVQQAGRKSNYFKDPSRLSVFVRFENKGNIQAAPLGSIRVKRGNELVYEQKFNTSNPHDMILPDSARRWEVPLKDIANIGRFTVTSTFTYGEKNQTVEVEEVFWVAPIGLVLGLVGLLILLAGGIVTGVVFAAKAIKRRRHHVPARRHKSTAPTRRRF